MTDVNHRMPRRALCAAVTLALSCSLAHAASLREALVPIEGQYIVVLKDDVAALAHERSSARRPDVATMAGEIGRAHRATVVRSYRNVLRGFVVRADDAALARLLADDRVAYVEEDGIVTIADTQSNATWGLDRVDQRDRPLSGTYTYDTTAATVHAYIIDTGVRASHSDFGGRVSGGYSAINDGRGTSDCHGHGTHVAGTVGGATWGVAKGVKLHPVRVLGCDGSGTNSGVIAGVDWVTQNHIKPAVANMSLGGGASTAVDSAVNGAINAGVTMVVAAGNDNGDACTGSPNRVPNAITVGSTTNTDARSSFSNYGTCLDIFAPGSSIMSAWYNSDTATNTISGTSMAAPHVAGAAALHLANNPTATPAQVRDAIVGNASSGKLTGIGAGSPNLLLYTVAGDTPPPCNSTGGTLANGVAASNLCGSTGAELRFTMSVPAGSSGLKFVTSGGTGDADLYVRFGAQPTTTTFDCKSEGSSNAETCNIATAQAGTYHVLVKAYSTFSGASLTGSYGSSSGCSTAVRTYSNTTDYSIRDNATVESPIAVSGRDGCFGQASTPVAVNIVHTYKGDLKVDLVAPDNSVYVLHNRTGSSTDNINQTFNVNLSSEALNGTWKLRVNDNYANDTGYINTWSVTF